MYTSDKLGSVQPQLTEQQDCLSKQMSKLSQKIADLSAKQQSFSIEHAAHFVLNQPWRRNVRDSISSLLSSLKWPTLQL